MGLLQQQKRLSSRKYHDHPPADVFIGAAVEVFGSLGPGMEWMACYASVLNVSRHQGPAWGLACLMPFW